MQHQENSFIGVGKIELYCQCWRPDATPRATLILIHGLGEHSGRFGNVVKCLAPRGIVVYSFDQRGHGRSPGQRGHVDSFGDFREDLHRFVQMITAREPNRPLFILGQSVGGLVALDYALHHPQALRGVIAFSPYLDETAAAVGPFTRLLSHVWPSFGMSIGRRENHLSRDRAVIEAYRNDSLVHDKQSARLATEVATAVAWTQTHAPELQLPLLILHGDADAISAPEGSRRFFERAGSRNKECLVYTEAFHELYNDILRERVVIDVAHWLEEQIERITTQRTENKKE